jgi:hypothetical protein
MKEYILCACNHYDDGINHINQPVNIKTGFVTCGRSHHNCIATFALIQKDINREETVKLMNNETQGFITNLDRFVDRLEALAIAQKADQIKGDQYIHDRIGLFSENLY